MSNPTPKRTYKTNSKRQKIIQYFRENPYARPVDVSKEFTYSYGATHTCKRLAAETPPEVKVVNLTNGTFKNGTGWVAKEPDTARIQARNAVNEAAAAAWYGVNTPGVSLTPEVEALVKAATPPPSLSSWADYGLWMDRDSLKGFLRGRAVEYLTKGDKLSVEEALRCVTKLAELTGE